MDRLLEQKKKSENQFRLKINDFITKSPYARKSNQLTPNILQQLLATPLFEGVCSNGKINVEKMCERVAVSEGQNSARQLYKVLGAKKQMKISQLHSILKSFHLHQFDLQQQITSLLFSQGSFSLSKLQKMMSTLNMTSLTTKDRQLLIQCFDFDRDGSIGEDDLRGLMELCRKEGEERKGTFFRAN